LKAIQLQTNSLRYNLGHVPLNSKLHMYRSAKDLRHGALVSSFGLDRARELRTSVRFRRSYDTTPAASDQKMLRSTGFLFNFGVALSYVPEKTARIVWRPKAFRVGTKLFLG